MSASTKAAVPPQLTGTMARFDSGPTSLTVATDLFASDIWVTEVIILPSGSGTVTVADKAPSPNNFLNAVPVPVNSPTVIDFRSAPKFAGGVRVTPSATAVVQVIGWTGG